METTVNVARGDRRSLRGIVALACVLLLTLAAWWYVSGSPSGQSCKMPATPICTDQPHKVGPEDWTLAVITVALVAVLGVAVIRRRSIRD